MQPEQERKDRKEHLEQKVRSEQKERQEGKVQFEQIMQQKQSLHQEELEHKEQKEKKERQADKEQDKEQFCSPELKRVEEFLEAIRQGAEIDTESEKSSVSAKKSTLPKTVPVDAKRFGAMKPTTEIIGAFSHGANWTPTLKYHFELPLFVLSQLDRQFVHEMDPDSPSFFYFQSKANHLNQGRPVKEGNITFLRYNLFEQRLVMELPATLSNLTPEIHSAMPLFLPSGTCPVSGSLFEFNQGRNLLDFYFTMRLHPELDTLKKTGVSSSLSQSQEPQPWLDLRGYAADGIRHRQEYLNGEITHYHLTGLADFVIINPSEECQFDIYPEKEPDKLYQLGKEEFQGILTEPIINQDRSINLHSDIHGIIVDVEDYNNKRLYLNHPAAGKAWGLILKIASGEVEGPRIEILCLRHVVSHQKRRTLKDQNNPTYEDMVVPPKVGDRVYIKALIQAYSAHDQLNLPITSDNKPRVFRNMCSIIKDNTKKEPVKEYDDTLYKSKQIIKGDPNRCFIHTKHIVNRIFPTQYQSPLRANYSSEEVGYLWHFPTVTAGARLIENAQGIYVSNGTVLAEFLARANKPATAEPLCEPSPDTHCSQSKPDPRLLSNLNPKILDSKERQELDISTYKNPFNIVLECLSLREALLYARTSRTSYPLVKQNHRYWYTQFQRLNLGPHIHFPDANNPNSLPGLRRWVEILSMQQALAVHKRQLDIDLVAAQQFIEPLKNAGKEALIKQFRFRKHFCGLGNEIVHYGEHLDMNVGKVVDIIQMACKSCRDTKLWKPKQTQLLWGIPEKQLEEVRAWKLPTEIWYTTDDLYHYFIQMHAQLSKPSVQEFDSVELTKSDALELQKRTKDLPPLVRSLVAFENTLLKRGKFISLDKDLPEVDKELQKGPRQ